MMRLLCMLVVLLGSVFLGGKLFHDQGYVLIAFNQWTVEMTLLVAMVALLLSFLVLFLVAKLIGACARMPRRIGEWNAYRRKLKAQRLTRYGMIAFSEGNWTRAQTLLTKAAPYVDAPLLNYLVAARSAQELNALELRDHYLSEAQRVMPNAEIAVGLTQAQLQLANAQWEQSLATLQHIKELSPKHPHVLKLLLQLYQEVKDWPQLITLLPEIKRHRVVEGDAYRSLQHRVYLNALSDLVQQANEADVELFFAHLPKTLNADTQLTEVFVRFLLEKNNEERAEYLLRRSLNKQFDDSLVAIYGTLHFEPGRLKYLESFLKKQSHSAALQLALGQMSEAADIWGQARSYYEKSLDLRPSIEAYAAYASLLDHLNDSVGAAHANRTGLLLAVSKLNQEQRS